MIYRPDIENPCDSCGCAVEAGKQTCGRCAAYSVLADLNERGHAALSAVTEKIIQPGVL